MLLRMQNETELNFRRQDGFRMLMILMLLVYEPKKLTWFIQLIIVELIILYINVFFVLIIF